MKTRLLRFVFFPLLVVACSGDDTVIGDAGSEGGKDATIDVVKDVGADATLDAPKDVATFDAPNDAADAPNDAADGAAADGGSTYHTPTCDGTVSASEYGGAEDVTTSGSQTWYVTWDATNLYVGLDNATLTEANVLYVGFSGNGYQTAQTYDGTGGTLPFVADGVVYAKTGYQESRVATSSAWGTASTGTVTFCSSGTTREEVIPWTALGATAIPSAFRFFAYATSGTGFVYGQVPTSLPTGNVGTSANWNHDFYVASTNDGSGNFPFDTTE
ncbi:MAG TPA: hypothetical protein VGH87_01860 [Polyangiaceae bacterium]|jgi:hypothetical protein